MAIAAPHFACLKELHKRNELPQGGSVLEIGEANWYGDIDLPEELKDAADDYDAVKRLYAWLFKTTDVVSIDLHGTPAAMPLDLNGPIDLKRTFATVINHGTAEHIFNVGNVFKVMHDHCAVNGLMAHESPFTGWIDHGFYTLQPTLYFDVAAANGYKVAFMAITQIEERRAIAIESREQLLALAAAGRIPHNAMLFVALRKLTDAPFRVPIQGVYGGTVSADVQAAWRTLR